jgi:hypothetical protein
MKINIKHHDIVNYVLGSCSYHPLELSIDPVRYAIADGCISDTKTNEVYLQSEDYCVFMTKVRLLKTVAKNCDASQVQEFCREIEDFSPLKINLL